MLPSLLKEPSLPCGPALAVRFCPFLLHSEGIQGAPFLPSIEVTGGGHRTLNLLQSHWHGTQLWSGNLLWVLGIPSASEQACHPGQVSPP